MMVFTTLFIAAIIVAGLYFIIRLLPWPWLNYLIVGAAGIVCFFPGDVHFRYIGLEVLALGFLVVWFHHKVIQQRTKQTSGPR